MDELETIENVARQYHRITDDYNDRIIEIVSKYCQHLSQWFDRSIGWKFEIWGDTVHAEWGSYDTDRGNVTFPTRLILANDYELDTYCRKIRAKREERRKGDADELG